MTKENKVTGRECRFVVHIPANNEREDYHLVKEALHYQDGSIKPNLRLIKNYQRPLWVTRKDKRTHKDKREWESIKNLVRHTSTESQLQMTVARVIGKPTSKLPLKRLTGEYPYIYGTDIESRVFIKKGYMNRFKGTPSFYSLATLDIETDVIKGTEDPIIISVSFKKQTHVFVDSNFLGKIDNVEARYKKLLDKHLPDSTKKRNQNFELTIADGPIEILKEAFNFIHSLQPDFLAIWNINFDVPEILKTFKKYNIKPSDILCDPRIPEELRVCEYIPGPNRRKKANGSYYGIDHAEQWHHFNLTASFHFIDAMCVFRQLRIHQQKRPSFALDDILNDELGVRKLKFDKADKYVKLRWHQFMQSEYKLEYVVYAAFDSLSMIELDEKTNDLAATLPANAEATDFENFRSQPRRIINAFFFYALELGYVLGTASYQNNNPKEDEYLEDADEFEDDEFMQKTETLGRDDWILTLPAHLSVLGLNILEDDPTLASNIRAYVYDSDAVAAYPTASTVTNQSKTTTSKELVDIEGVDESVFRMQNLNLVLGNVNSVEYCTKMFNAPQLPELLSLLES